MGKTKKCVILTCIVSIIVTTVVTIIAAIPISRIKSANDKDLQGLYNEAQTFNERYVSEEDSNAALKLADDYVEEDNQVKVLFENKESYLVLSYDMNKNFIKGQQFDKNVLKRHTLLVVIPIIAFIVSFFIIFNVFIYKKSNH